MKNSMRDTPQEPKEEADEVEAVRAVVVTRGLRVAAVLALFTVVLFGFYAEIALSVMACELIGITSDARFLVQVIGFAMYAASVAAGVFFATGADNG